MVPSKRGQITLFIILGIIILAAVSLLFYVSDRNIGSSAGGTASAQENLEMISIKDSVSQFVGNCLTKELGNALEDAGKKGWNFDAGAELEDGRIIQAEKRVSRSVKKPAADELRSSLKKYLDISAQNCVEFGDNFPQAEVNAVFKSIDITLKDSSIALALDADTSIKKGSASAQINRYEAEKIFPVNKIVSYLGELTDIFSRNYPMLPLGDIAIRSFEDDFDYQLISLDRNNALFIISYANITNMPGGYTFAFIVEYPDQAMPAAYRLPDIAAEEGMAQEKDITRGDGISVIAEEGSAEQGEE